jgi:trehalose 6-phosphate synthase
MIQTDRDCPSAGDQVSRNPIILMSSRGPIEFSTGEDGRLIQRRADGGVATVLGAVANTTDTTWLAGARSEADRIAAAAGDAITVGHGSRLRLIDCPQDIEDAHNEFCNTVLWFLQHSMLDRLDIEGFGAYALQGWYNGYLPMNRAYAAALARETHDEVESVMIHDYHLYAAPRFIRERFPNAFLQHFVHIPWPDCSQWDQLPGVLSASIVRGLLANDSVVFQADDNVRNFLDCVARYIDGAQVDFELGLVTFNGHETRVWANPVSVKVEDLEEAIESEEAMLAQQKLASKLGPKKTIVRVDRLDPSKNIDRGFEAFARMLDRYPQWRGQVRFLAFLVPTRGGLQAYQSHAREVFQQAEAINSRFGDGDWQPIEVFFQQNRTEALVALSMYDVLLVNSVADGLNLVSKEGAIVNQRDGVLVLSKNVGAYHELQSDALGIDPYDVDATADALHTALAMPETERHSRAEGLRRAVREHEFQDWLDAILRDVPAQCCGHCGELASAHVEPISTIAVEEDYAAAVGGGS